MSAAGACCCQGTAAAASTTTALLAFLRLVTFRTGMIILELATTAASIFYLCSLHDNSRASYYCCIDLLSMQSPAPVCSLAEPPPAASPQLGRWVCQQGLRSARIRGLLLCLLLPVLLLLLRRRLPFLAFLRLVAFRTGMTVILLLLLRIQPARDSRHTAVCLGTSS